MKKPKFWFYKPEWWWTGFLPFQVGTDEWNRKVYTFGYPFTGQLNIVSRKSHHVWDGEENIFIGFEQDNANDLSLDFEEVYSGDKFRIHIIRGNETGKDQDIHIERK